MGLRLRNGKFPMKIPDVNSHTALNLKILQFLDDNDTKHLKIVYYAGHGKLSNHGQAIWTRLALVNIPI
jgi:hypothetical protein